MKVSFSGILEEIKQSHCIKTISEAKPFRKGMKYGFGGIVLTESVLSAFSYYRLKSFEKRIVRDYENGNLDYVTSLYAYSMERYQFKTRLIMSAAVALTCGAPIGFVSGFAKALFTHSRIKTLSQRALNQVKKT